MRQIIYSLKEKGFKDTEIIENIFLNYSSSYENDTIYKIKKELSEKLKIELNCIKLIGSAHSGIKKEEDEIEDKKDPNDLDFALITPKLFSEFLFEIRKGKLVKHSSENAFKKNLYLGKIHFMYLKENYINLICKEINKKYDQKKISVCLYLSERDFIENLEFFFKDSFTTFYDKYRVSNSNLGNCELKPLEKIN